MVLLGRRADLPAPDQPGDLRGHNLLLDAEVQEGEEDVRAVQADRVVGAGKEGKLTLALIVTYFATG